MCFFTLEVFAEPVEETCIPHEPMQLSIVNVLTTTGDGIMEANLSEEYRFEKSCACVSVVMIQVGKGEH
jgi:hypothetical protein